MGRPRRTAVGGVVYHVLNRAHNRARMFDSPGDYFAFEKILAEAMVRVPMRILAWCLMPNHWHLVLWPREDGHLSDYVHLAALTHAQRWHASRGTAGCGHLYQGRFKSFVVQDDAHFLTLCRYVEANALRARLVERAEDWRWCSLSGRHPAPRKAILAAFPWPVPRPSNWVELVNEPLPEKQVSALRNCAQRGAPYGEAQWVALTAARLGLQSTLRKPGRPKQENGS